MANLIVLAPVVLLLSEQHLVFLFFAILIIMLFKNT
jgi:hypothetical protein